MSDVRKEEKAVTPPAKPTKIVRLTLHGSDCQAIEALSSDFVKSARQHRLKFQGPKRMPVRRISHTTRKSPCGQGTNTWDKFEMRLFKRVIDIFVSDEQLKIISQFATVDKNVAVDATVREIKTPLAAQ